VAHSVFANVQALRRSTVSAALQNISIKLKFTCYLVP